MSNENGYIDEKVHGKFGKAVSELATFNRLSAENSEEEVYHAPLMNRCDVETVNFKLGKLGVDVDRVSCCVKAAMSKGLINLTGDPSDLKQLIIKGEYQEHQFKVYLKDVLYQQDYAGCDYEDGSIESPVVCICCREKIQPYDQRCHVYVTSICDGYPEFDSGKFHNHCTECEDFGQCIGDYRDAHCSKCDNHYCGSSCYNCGEDTDDDSD